MHRILRIDRNPPDSLNITVDNVLYSQIQMNQTLIMIGSTCQATGGIKQVGKGCAPLGFILILIKTIIMFYYTFIIIRIHENYYWI